MDHLRPASTRYHALRHGDRRDCSKKLRLVRGSRAPTLPRESALPDPELFVVQTNSEQSSPLDSILSGWTAVDVIPPYDSVLLDAGWAESVNRGDGGRDHCHHSQPNEEGYPVLGHRESRLVIEPLSMSGQHNVGCDHEPKRIVTYKRNIDKYRNDCEQGDNKRNDMATENVEHCNSRGHVRYLP